MTLPQAPILTDGATHPAEEFRMMVRDLARGSQGITEGDDLKVTQLGTPGAGVQVADGSGTIRGQANTWQGSYTAYNVGSDTVDIAATGASPRYDMLVLRVLDPEYEGSLNPATDQVVFFDVVSNVASTATAPPAGMTAIPLARIAIPASTATITNAMITDLRGIANPRKDRELLTWSPSGSASQSGTTYNGGYPGGPVWSIAVPTWATKARISLRISGLWLSTSGGFASVSGKLGTSAPLQTVTLDDNGTSGAHRIMFEVADTVAIPATYRGTTQSMSLTLQLRTGNTAAIGCDTVTTFIGDIEFEEAPR